MTTLSVVKTRGDNGQFEFLCALHWSEHSPLPPKAPSSGQRFFETTVSLLRYADVIGCYRDTALVFTVGVPRQKSMRLTQCVQSLFHYWYAVTP